MAENLRLTESGETRITEDGENRILEQNGDGEAGTMTIANNLTGDGVASYKYALKPKVNEQKNI